METKTKPPGLLLTYAEAAEFLGVTVDQLRRWVLAKSIPFKRATPGGKHREGRILFSRERLEEWAREDNSKDDVA